MRSALVTIVTAACVATACRGASFDAAIADDAGVDVHAVDGGDVGENESESVSCPEQIETTLLWPHDGEACPEGTSERTAQTNPRLVAGGCGGCSCRNTGVTCAGKYDVAYGETGSCGAGSTSLSVVDGACTPLANAAGAAYVKWPGRLPLGGQCAAAYSGADSAKIATDTIRFCVATTHAALCRALAKRWRSCVDTADISTCKQPVNRPMSVGERTMLYCGGCECGGPFGGTYSCRVEYYVDAACTQLVGSDSMTSSCQGPRSGAAYFKAVPHETSSGCMLRVSPNGVSSNGAGFTDARLLCCEK